MLSIKDINEVSFRKSNFSGYNSDDVDQFIDEVLETVTALTKENAEIKTRKTDDSAAVHISATVWTAGNIHRPECLLPLVRVSG